MKLRHWWAYPAALLGCSGCASSLPANHPCSEENPRAHAFLGKCAAAVAALCPPNPDVPCELEAACEREWARRCEQ